MALEKIGIICLIFFLFFFFFNHGRWIFLLKSVLEILTLLSYQTKYALAMRQFLLLDAAFQGIQRFKMITKGFLSCLYAPISDVN